MRALFSISLLVFLLACKGSSTDSTVSPNVSSTKVRLVNGVYFADDNVSVRITNTPRELNKYYTLLDTLDLSDPVLFSDNICALVDEGDSLRVSWRLAGKAIPNYQQDKIWNQQEKKWLICNYGTYSLNREPALLILEGKFLFLKSNKTVIREIPIEVISKDYYYDLYEVNFGMNRSQVKSNEVARSPNFPNIWQEPTTSTGVLNFSTSLSILESLTYYEFEGDKLKRVSDAILDTKNFANLQVLANRYKVPEKPTLKIDRTGSVAEYDFTKEQTWNNGKIKFTLSKKEIQLSNSEKKKLLAITYEKL